MHLALSLVFFILLACTRQEAVSTLQHDAAQYVQSPDAWHWQDLTPEQFETIHIPSNGWGTADEFLPESHAATQRMNYLLRKIHQRLREHYPEQLKNVPLPRARIYKNEGAEAYVTAVPVCYSVPVQLGEAGPAQDFGSSVGWITLDHDGKLTVDQQNGLCVKREMTRAEAGDYFRWINQNIRRSASQHGQTESFCEIEVEDTGKGFHLVPGAACERATELEGVDRSQGFVMWKTQPYIILYSGILRHVDAEVKIMTTLAHELAHYYRSHLTAFAGDYDYFYRLDTERNPSHKPEPDPALRERGRDIRAAAQLLQSDLYEEADQRYASEFFYPIWALVSRACPSDAQEGCPAACQDLMTLVRDDEVYASFGDWPYAEMPEAGHLSYQRYEKALSQCAPQLRFTDASTSGQQISLADMETAFASENFGELMQVMGISDLAVFRDQSLEQLLSRLETGLKDGKIRAREILMRATADGLGLYTWEQEADEQQMETVALLGLDPVQLVKWDVDFYDKFSGSYDEYSGLDMQRCRELLMKDWMEDGKPVLVPVADFNNAHHSDCFRIFTTSREITAHQWDQVKAEVPLRFLSDAAWKKLQASLSHGDGSSSQPGANAGCAEEFEEAQKYLVIKRIRLGFFEIVIKTYYSAEGEIIRSRVSSEIRLNSVFFSPFPATTAQRPSCKAWWCPEPTASRAIQ
jgi:hypothetical protein